MGKISNRPHGCYNDAPPAEPTIAGQIRAALRELRERYGPRPWLTVASGVVAEGVRLARMSGQDMFDLLRSDEVRLNGLPLYKNVPGNQRLRAAFDNHGGGFGEDGGVLRVNLFFDGKRNNIVSRDDDGVADYCEELFSMNERRPYDGQRLDVAIAGLPCPDIPALIGRPVAEIFPNAPRCLRSGSTRITAMTYKPDEGHRNRLRADVSTHWETLGLMPAEVSRELGVGPQLTTDQMPWLSFATPPREGPVPRVRCRDGIFLGPVAGGQHAA